MSELWYDWSGRGRDVEFGPTEEMPFEQGKLLGRGASADVHEVICQGTVLARKQIHCNRKIKMVDVRSEIDILRRANHKHIVKLVGSYTQARILGLLLYPAAICDLTRYMEDLEDARSGDWTSDLWPRFGVPTDLLDHKTTVSVLSEALLTVFGCLATGINHLHQQSIRHKDIKPQNVLLIRDNIYITDFGLSKDLSDASTSITDGLERGTYRYFAPEVARYERRGRAADIFSMGCVFLEVFTVYLGFTLTEFADFRKIDGDASFHRNLDRVSRWIYILTGNDHLDTRLSRLGEFIEQMIAVDATQRPNSLQMPFEAILRIQWIRRSEGQRLMIGPCRDLETTMDMNMDIIKHVSEAQVDISMNLEFS
ncbi:MAG: hypothetical protein M1836_008160 [Candelina mexicana]|nr:MAG: hypothetical protein M1836_008160 [Candelina mexicana]